MRAIVSKSPFEEMKLDYVLMPILQKFQFPKAWDTWDHKKQKTTQIIQVEG